MTRAKWAELTDEQKVIKVAELCGITKIDRVYVDTDRIPAEYYLGYTVKDNISKKIPDYLNDLNAMHEAEKKLHNGPSDTAVYESYLIEWLGRYGSALYATAAQRAEAFALTMESE